MKNVSMRVLVAATGVICALGMVAGCGGKDSAEIVMFLLIYFLLINLMT